MINKTEDQIMESWISPPSRPVVSICCITYNHVDYISEAIKGFLMQKVEFPFEILIHDDASNDGTSDIIREFSENFPNIVKPIIQSDNQLSKGKRANTNFNFPRAKGEFIAICEGDDFWTNKSKLKIQVDVLRSENLDLCFHPVTTLKYLKNGKTKEFFKYGFYGMNKRVIEFSKVLKKGGNAIPASSILIRASVLRNIKNKYPDFYINRLTLFYLQVFGSLKGGALYIPEYMSTYRSNIIGSWSYNNMTSIKALRNNSINYINSLIIFNEISRYQYSKHIGRLIRVKIYSFFKSNIVSVKDKIGFLCLKTVDDKAIGHRLIYPIKKQVR